MTKKLTTREAATLTGYSQSHVQAAVGKGDLPAEKFGRAWVIDEQDALAWAADKELHRVGRPTTGEISLREAGDMLGKTRQTVSEWIKKGWLPRELTAEAVVEYALEKRGKRWMYEGDRALYGVSLSREGLRFGRIGYEQDDTLVSDEYISFDKLFDAMKEVAALDRWRVVKGETK